MKNLVCSSLGLVVAVLASGCAQRDAGPPTLTYVPTGGSAPLPFSAAVRVGDMVYLSGQLGTDSTGTVVQGGIQAETRQALTNIKRLLENNGSSLDHVVKCTAMLADMKEWASMNEVYVTFFPPGRLPARSAFGTTGLARGARMELECMAIASKR